MNLLCISTILFWPSTWSKFVGTLKTFFFLCFVSSFALHFLVFTYNKKPFYRLKLIYHAKCKWSFPLSIFKKKTADKLLKLAKFNIYCVCVCVCMWFVLFVFLFMRQNVFGNIVTVYVWDILLQYYFIWTQTQT